MALALLLVLMSSGCMSIEKRLASQIQYVIPSHEGMPGDLIQLTAQLPKGVKKGTVRFLKRTFTMYPRLDQEIGTYTAYIPIPNKVKPGQYALQATFPVIEGEEPITNRFKISVWPKANKQTIHQIRLSKFKFRQLQADRKTISRLLLTSRYQPDKLYDFLLPLSGRIVSTYGTTRIYNKNQAIALKGLEIVPLATGSLDVKSVADGQVRLAQRLPMLGRTVLIDHGRSFMSLYCHLRAYSVSIDQVVKRGQLIGQVGRSGQAAVGRRLYFQLFVAGVAINIERYLDLDLFE